MFLGYRGAWRAYIRQTSACRPCTHRKFLLTFAGVIAHNHVDVAG